MYSRILLEISLLLEIPISDIDFNASFVQLGGNSLSAIILSRTCRGYRIDLNVETILSSARIADLLSVSVEASSSGDPNGWVSHNTRPKSLSDKSDGLINTSKTYSIPEAAVQEEPNSCYEVQHVPSSPKTQTFPMTEMQLILMYGSQNDGRVNIIKYYETYPSHSIPAVKHAWRIVVDSEPIFRTTFVVHDGKGYLMEQEKADFNWSETTVSTQKEFDTLIDEDCFDANISMSFQVITIPGNSHGAGKSTVKWCVHHALIDGYSRNLVINKLRTVLAGRRICQGPSFARFAKRLDKFRDQSKERRHLFWKRRLECYPSAAGELLLPAPISQPSPRNKLSEVVMFDLPLAEVSMHAQQLGVTSASVYCAAWALALTAYVGSETTVFGVVLSGRNLPIATIENLVGPVINMLPFHAKMNGAAKTGDYLHQTFSHLVELISFQHSSPNDGFSRRFSSAMAIDVERPAAGAKYRDHLHEPYSTVMSDIPLYVLIEADGTVGLNYHTDRYQRTDIASLGETFCNAVVALLKPHSTISMCLERIMPKQQRSQLQRFGNWSSPTTVALSRKADLVTLFEEVVAVSPKAIAVEKGAHSLSYADLDSQATCVAHHLCAFVKPGEVICVHADRSVRWIIAIYGILKAGAIYCPFDANWPTDVRNRNFETAHGTLFLTPEFCQKELRPMNCASCTSVEELLLLDPPDHELKASSSLRCPVPEANSYLCLTSGSSGVPKAVMCRHESLIAFQSDLEARLFATPGRRIAQTMSPAFDGSIHEIFSTFSYGATLVLEDGLDPFKHVQLADSAIITPSIAQVLDPVEFPKLSAVYLVGEQVPQRVNDRWASHKVLYNMYGPTEATCGATIKRLYPNQPVTIGHPVPSMRIYILDTRQVLVPPGVIGEIHLAGIQISEGYFGRQRETMEHFVPDTVCKASTKPMYKTGDHGYWNSDGDLVCLGRKDRQIKLRGFRIDLDDLEIRISNEVPSTRAVALVQKKDYLVAMIRPASLIISVLRSEIARFLPSYALPRHILAVDAFPLTTAGKVDYAAIRNSEYFKPRPSARPPKSRDLETIAAFWREILNLAPEDPISSDSNFVDLGGNSIQQMLLATKMTGHLGKPVSLRIVLQNPILRDLARELKALRSCRAWCEPKEIFPEHELSWIEKDWWDKYDAGLGSSAFNVSFVAKVGRNIDLESLTRAWNIILARHRILSCRYASCQRNGVRREYSELPPRVERVTHIDIWQEINRPFDLRLGNLITVSLSPVCMAVRISHILCDLTTLRTLLHDVASVYRGSDLREDQSLDRERLVVHSITPSSSFDFWSEYLANIPQDGYAIAKKQDRVSYSGASKVCKLPMDLFQDMIDFSAKQKVTFHQMALAAVALALQHDTGPHDVILGAPYLNRRTDDEMKTIGLFLEPLPIRIRYSSASTVNAYNVSNTSQPIPKHGSFIKSVQASSQAALSRATPWTKLVNHLQLAINFPENPLFSVMVTFHDDREETKSPIPDCKTLYTWSEGAKFSLMTEFLAVSQDTLMLRIEYDTACYESQDVELLQHLIVTALRDLVTEVDYDEMKERMREIGNGGRTCDDIERAEAKGFFGVEIHEL